jgi:hypothetical protein
MRLHRPGQWFSLSPGKLYFPSCDSVLIGGGGVRYIKTTFSSGVLAEFYQQYVLRKDENFRKWDVATWNGSSWLRIVKGGRGFMNAVMNLEVP